MKELHYCLTCGNEFEVQAGLGGVNYGGGEPVLRPNRISLRFGLSSACSRVRNFENPWAMVV